MPPFSLLFKPAFMVGTLFQFVRVWFGSRQLRLILLGLPAIIVGLVVVGITMSVNSAINTTRYSTNYERALFEAVKAGDVSGQEVALNSLLELQPNEHRHRFNLALLRLQQKRTANGLSTMRSLADRSYPPAQLWIAKGLLSEPNQQRVTEAIHHLKDVVKSKATPRQHAQANTLLGELYLRLQQPTLAVPFLRVAAKDNPSVKLSLAECLLKLGNTEEAARMASQAEKEFQVLVSDSLGSEESQSEIRVRWAECLRIQGRLQEAQSVLLQGLALADDDPVLRRAFGKLIAISATGERLRGASDVARYAELLTQALRYDSENLVIVTRLAQLPLKPGQLDDATLETAREIVTNRREAVPDQVELEMLQAWVERMQGEPLKAIETMRRVVEAHPELRLSLAQLLRLTGDSDGAKEEAKVAIRYFTEQIGEDPEDHVNYVQLAQAYEFLDYSDRALEVITIANQEYPHPDLAVRLTQFRLTQFDKLRRDETDRAKQLRLILEIQKLEPDNLPAIVRLGALARGADDDVAKQAKERLYEQLTRGQNLFQVYALLGTIAEEEGDFKTAAQHLDQAVRRKPNDPVVCNNLAHVLANVENGDLDVALDLVNNALKTMPGHPEVLETRGEIYVKLELYADAEADLVSCLGKSGDVRDVHRYLASAYAGLGNADLAARHKELSEKPDP